MAGRDVAYGDWYPMKKKLLTEKEVIAKYGSGLENDLYGLLANHYVVCVNKYLKQWDIPQVLEKQLGRRDLDTICATELYQMKKHFLETDVLKYESFWPDKPKEV